MFITCILDWRQFQYPFWFLNAEAIAIVARLGSIGWCNPAGGIILLSHTPWEAEKAAKTGVDLMLSGHTHGGQIWPFDYLVRTRYPLLEGRYEIDGMTDLALGNLIEIKRG